jgi:hypothetical protein
MDQSGPTASHWTWPSDSVSFDRNSYSQSLTWLSDSRVPRTKTTVLFNIIIAPHMGLQFGTSYITETLSTSPSLSKFSSNQWICNNFWYKRSLTNYTVHISVKKPNSNSGFRTVSLLCITFVSRMCSGSHDAPRM